MATKKFGLTSYNEPAQAGGKRRSEPVPEDERFDFVRLKEGENCFRFITEPYTYYMVRFKASEDEKGFGKKIRCSVPVEKDPAVMLGNKDKQRWLVGVIDRADGKVKLLDYHILVFEKIEALNKNKKWGDPQKYDLTFNYNPKAAVASQIIVTPDPHEPLTEQEVALRDEVMPKLERALQRFSAPLKRETVLARMRELGWNGEDPLTAASDENESDGSSDEYSFPTNGQTVAQA